LKTNFVEATFEGHVYGVESVSFSPDGNKLASGSSDETIKIWNLKTHSVETTLKGHSNRVL
jgi:WD40 repeat protein